MRKLRVTHVIAAGVVLSLCCTWVDAREQNGAPARPANQPVAKPAVATTASNQNHRAMLDRYCVTCHSDRLKTAGLTLESIDTANIAAAPDVWEKVIRKVRVGMMPPQGSPSPDQASRDALVTWLTTALDAQRRRASRSRPAARAPFESRRVRQRHSRPPGTRDRSVGTAAG